MVQVTWQQTHEACLLKQLKQRPNSAHYLTTGGGKTKESPPADTKHDWAVRQALDLIARRLTWSICLSIVKSFTRGLQVSRRSQILIHRGQRSVCGAHLHVIFTSDLVKSIACGENGLDQYFRNPHALSLRPISISASDLSRPLFSKIQTRVEVTLWTVTGWRKGAHCAFVCWQVDDDSDLIKKKNSSCIHEDLDTLCYMTL